MFKNLPIRFKLLIYYSILFTVSLSLGSAFIYTIVQRTITANIESELEHTTQAILNMVKTAADVSIKNHLRTIAEQNLQTARYHYEQYRSGRVSKEKAMAAAAKLYLSQTIGKSGYTYCLDSSGVVLIHPEDELVHDSVAQHEFVQDQVEMKEGYIEYQWKNPRENRLRPKALYMTYFEPWDWIISVTSYRREFKDLVNVDDFKDSILKFRFGETGYSFVMDRNGTALIHPKLQGVNILEDQMLPDEFFEKMVKRKQGKLIYPWKNPDETRQRYKLVMFNYIPDYDWLVASSSYLDEFYRPLHTIRYLMLLTFAITLFLIIALTFRLSASITKPLKKLMNHFHQVGETSFTTRMQWDSKDEIGQLASYFNDFMDQLERYSNSLKQEIQSRRKVETDLRISEERYRSVTEATPDPIVVYSMKGEVIFLNPAFTRVFGWTLEECIGKKMDYFVPDENWPETRSMIKAVQSGETLSLVETRRFNKRGDIVPVTISAATYRGPSGRLAGSIVILRDVTKTMRLRKQIMDISERERQKFGQDLHDDLSPHLIGIQGLCTVLEANLVEESSAQAPMSGQINELIGNAIAKIRSLARGLCPVHLVSRGLFSALADMAARTDENSGIRVRFSGDEPVDLSDNIVATHLYFIAQEAVANAVKHAGADEIVVELKNDGETVLLTVADNGRGFDKNDSANGIGLQIMEYRAKISGATMRVTTKKSGGTTIQVFLKSRLKLN
mgnify:CR=1 FL=1